MGLKCSTTFLTRNDGILPLNPAWLNLEVGTGNGTWSESALSK